MLKKFLEYTSLLLIVTIFIGLGLWQLDRARSLKEILNAPPPPVSAPVALQDLAEPRTELDKKNDSKPVNASGF